MKVPWGLDGVFATPDSGRVCCVARGFAYVVDVADPAAGAEVAHIATATVTPVPEAYRPLLSVFVDITALGQGGVVWRSGRLVLDDLAIVETSRDRIVCTGSIVPDVEEARVVLDAGTGQIVEGGAAGVAATLVTFQGVISDHWRRRAICRPNRGRCVVMATALDIFRLMIRDEIAPGLRRMGFKGSGQSFTLPSESHWVLVGFQKSTYSNADAVRFTINVTVVSKRRWREAQGEHSYLSDRPSANISYGGFAWQRRIGQLRPDPDIEDKWWTIGTGRPTGSVSEEVLDAIRVYAVPAIDHQLASEPGER